MIKRYELSNDEWNRIKEKLPPEKTGKKGRPGKDNRSMLNGMLWITRSGSQWRNLPDCYGPWESVYSRFRKWQETGVLEDVFRALSSDADMENLSIDSTSIRVHESSNGNKKGLKTRQ